MPLWPLTWFLVPIKGGGATKVIDFVLYWTITIITQARLLIGRFSHPCRWLVVWFQGAWPQLGTQEQEPVRNMAHRTLAWLQQAVSYLLPALTGSQALPVEVLAAGFAFAGRGIDGPLQVQSGAGSSGSCLWTVLLGLDLWPRHLGQQVFHGPLRPVLQNRTEPEPHGQL